MRIFGVVFILLVFVNYKMFSIDDISHSTNNFTNIQQKVNAFYNLKHYITNESSKIKLIEIGKSIFDDIIVSNKNNREVGSELYISILETLMSINDVRTLTAIIPGVAYLAYKKDFVVKYTNEAIPYILEYTTNEAYSDKMLSIVNSLIDSDGIVFTEEENNLLIQYLLERYTNKNTKASRVWIASIILKLNPKENEINSYKLYEVLQNQITNNHYDYYNMAVNDMLLKNFKKTKIKRIKEKLNGILTESKRAVHKQTVIINEKEFKSSIDRQLSEAKKNDLIKKRKVYLEVERQKLISELSNTLLELEKE